VAAMIAAPSDVPIVRAAQEKSDSVNAAANPVREVGQEEAGARQC
jgi:hypothetical protein